MSLHFTEMAWMNSMSQLYRIYMYITLDYKYNYLFVIITYKCVVIAYNCVVIVYNRVVIVYKCVHCVQIDCQYA